MMEQETQRERMKRYINDMAFAVAFSTHKDLLAEARIDPKIIREVATLAIHIALEKYDTENRVIIAQAKSFERMAAQRNASHVPMHLLKTKDD